MTTRLEEELCAKVKGLEHMAREMNTENGRLQAKVAVLTAAGDRTVEMLFGVADEHARWFEKDAKQAVDQWEAAKKHG